jgi:hypothetical protein
MLESDDTEKKQKPVYYRVITTIIFFTSLSMCVYQIYDLTLIYLSDPIETQMKVIMHDSIKFPAVTICNLNPVRRSRSVEFQVYPRVYIQVKLLAVELKLIQLPSSIHYLDGNRKKTILTYQMQIHGN